jgi:hypothetical protein
MMAAGLSPILAYGQGGASTPQGAMAKSEPLMNSQTSGVSSAMQAMQVAGSAQQIMQSQALTSQSAAETARIRSETLDNALNTSAKAASMEQSKAAAAQLKEQATRTREEASSVSYDVLRKKAEIDAASDASGGQRTGFAADVAKRRAEARLKELEIPQAHAEAEFAKKYGAYVPAARLVGSVTNSATSLGRAFGR